jgi:prophage DNA circulation protein
MSWRDQYQAGSFRGAAFSTVRHEYSGGRRAEVHEFPGRDDALVEDLGRRTRQFQIECFVWGAEYRAARDALIAALETAGPGTLIHPWHGTRTVAVLDFSLTESTDEGGFANFQIGFTEAGQQPSQAVSSDTGVAARALAKTTLADAPVRFADRFALAEAPAFVEDAAAKIVSGLAGAAQISAGLSGGAGAALRAFDATLDRLGAPGILRTPLALGQAIVGLVTAVSLLGSSHRGTIAALSSLAASGDGLDDVPGATSARRQQRENQAAIVDLLRTSCAAELVRTVSLTSLSSYQEAVALRDTLSGQIDGWALSSADAGNDADADVLDALRLALVRDITARGGTLARLYDYPLSATQPALVIAQRLYGHVADLADRADDIVARNAVRHPGFMPGGAAIKVLTDG